MIWLVPVIRTGKEKTSGFTPETVILLATWIWLTAVLKTRFVKGIIPPTAPLKITFPTDPDLKVRDAAPLSVLEKLMLAPVAADPPFVVSNNGKPLTTTGPVIVIVAPFVVMSPLTLIAADPE